MSHFTVTFKVKDEGSAVGVKFVVMLVVKGFVVEDKGKNVARILPIEDVMAHYPLNLKFASIGVCSCLIILEVFGDGVDEGVLNAAVPCGVGNVVGRILDEVVELGFGVISVKKAQGGAISFF